MIDYCLILNTFYSKYKWTILYNNYESIDWLDEFSKPTKEEIDSKWQETKLIDNKRKCKEKAKQLLLNSDWSEIPTVIRRLNNYLEWEKYRIEIREYIINPIENPVFPIEPNAIWKEV
jgi:hypothetical protein